jgi:hypothetical protein
MFLMELRTLLLLLFNDASKETMIGEWWIGKDVEGSGRGLTLTYYPGIAYRGEENHEIPHTK